MRTGSRVNKIGYLTSGLINSQRPSWFKIYRDGGINLSIALSTMLKLVMEFT